MFLIPTMVCMKRFVAVLFILLCIPLASASQITVEDTRVQLSPQGVGNVTIERHYADISSPKISYFVPAQYNPRQLSAADDLGELDCTVQSFESGEEIVCNPRKMDDYTVEIQFFADFVTRDRQEDTYAFSYVKQVLTPTQETNLQVVLPEGFGLVQSRNDPSYAPDFATVGSQGRRIFVEWQRDDISIGDTARYSMTYEKLEVLDRVPISWAAAALLAAVVLSGGVAYYFRRHQEDNGDSIAAIFPVLKDDEQLVIRYIIDNDGEVEQREIVENVDYSKAKISKLLSDLEDRDLVEKEKQGRVNIVKLAKEVGDLASKQTVDA